MQAALVAGLGLLGRHQVTVLPFIGHGTGERVHVRARVVLGSRSLPDPEPAPAPPEADPRPATWRTLRTSLARFLTVELPRCPVTVLTPAGPAQVRTDREGYVDAVVEAAGLPPGWHEVPVRASWRGQSAEVPVPVLVVGPQVRLAVISDVDDTVIESGITRGLELLRLTLLTDVSQRVPLPGAAELYQALTESPDGSEHPVFYLSTSPWNLHDLLSRFICLRGFPPGPLLLTDWGPGQARLLRIGAEQHKLTLIRQVLADHPGLGVVLVGDTGQIDPEIYAVVSKEAPDRIRAVYVRRTAGISAARAAEIDALAAAVSAAGVPMLAVDDSTQIAEHAASIGLLDPVAVAAVRAASGA